ncbi:cupredoxin domain-containing protein [Candidatus Uhrbacteria bacterium]|nr:cupredoxin domain-containing protein [Candidatus Uhrbacteria bacterium]
MKQDTEVIVTDAVDITVEGGYSPASIVLQKDKMTKITFLRKDPSPCLEEVVLSDFNIRKTLPLNQPVTIELTPRKTGEFPFSCGMNMFHGKIIVKD